jgi:hypothetical protein
VSYRFGQIVVDVREATNEVTLHAKEINILSATYNANDGTSHAVVEIAYSFKNKTVRVDSMKVVGLGDLIIIIACAPGPTWLCRAGPRWIWNFGDQV